MSGPVTLWQLCVWTYRRQRAHLYLRDKFDWFQWDWASAGMEHDDPRPSVHHDAAMVHRAVLGLGMRSADVIIWHALTGSPPEIPDLLLEPRPYPLDTTRADDYGRAEVDGRMIDYAVRVLDRVPGTKPIYKRIGGKGMQQVGTQAVTVDVKYCPIVWEPDPIFTGAAMSVYRGWAGAMAELHKLLPSLGLRDHRVTDQPAPIPPMPNTRLVFDSWREGTGSEPAAEATLERTFPPFSVALTEDGDDLRHRVARSVLR